MSKMKMLVGCLSILVLAACNKEESINDDVVTSSVDNEYSKVISIKHVSKFIEGKLDSSGCLPPVDDKALDDAFNKNFPDYNLSNTLPDGTNPFSKNMKELNTLWGYTTPLSYVHGKIDVTWYSAIEKKDVTENIDYGYGAYALPTEVFIGDTFYKNHGYDDALGVLGHEYGHVIQGQEKWDITNIKERELMADFFGGIYLGFIYNYKYDDTFARLAYSIGDNCTSSVQHHGTSIQRQTAARIGLRTGKRLKYNGNITLEKKRKALYDVFYSYIHSIDIGNSSYPPYKPFGKAKKLMKKSSLIESAIVDFENRYNRTITEDEKEILDIIVENY